MPFLELKPEKLLCKFGSTTEPPKETADLHWAPANHDNWFRCTQEQLCEYRRSNNVFSHSVDKEHPLYLSNWVEQLDLLCASKERIGLLGMSFFVGLFLGLFVLPKLGDKYGRRPVITCSSLLSTMFTLCLLMSRSFELSLLCITGMGITWSGK